MGSNEDLLSSFSIYRSKGLIDDGEFARLAPCLLDNGNAPPEWIARLAEACALADSGRIALSDLPLLKKGIFASIQENAEDDSGSHAGNSPQNDAVRDNEAGNIVRICTGIACIIGLIPMPVADAPFLIITQYVMLRKICGKYGRQPGAALVLVVVSALLGPLLFDVFVKRFPFAGSIAGACIGAGFTWFVGSRVQKMLRQNREFTFANILKAIFTSK